MKYKLGVSCLHALHRWIRRWILAHIASIGHTGQGATSVMADNQMGNEILHTFDQRIFYHGTDLEAAEAIDKEGFKVWFHDENWTGHVPAGGLLGIGGYVSCNWRMALWFGSVLLHISVPSGTRILDASVRPDAKVLDSLQKEFGREILTKPPWLAVPHNKKLTLREVIAIVRYHFREAWLKGEGRPGRYDYSRWPKRRVRNASLLCAFRPMLTRYGFHGFGSPDADLGIVIFDQNRLLLEEVVGYIPAPDYRRLWDTDFRQLQSIQDVKGWSTRKAESRDSCSGEAS